jgi:hypothetical protein
MAQRSRYWSCTPFADWLRGTPKLKLGTGEEWDNWDSSAKAAHPIRYWIAEEALDAVQNFIWWPVDQIYNLKYYINNRWVTRTHSLTAHRRDIAPGTWCDVGNRFMPCLFNELVDYVEVELAWWHIAWDDEAKKKFKAPFWAAGWFRWRTWRCPEAGIENLEWQMSLKVKEDYGVNPGDEGYGEPTHQAERAKEILALYKWWTEVYPNRPDPHDAGGWSEYCDRMREEFGENHWLTRNSKDPELNALGNRALDKTHEIEEAYNQEDEDMMIRLIRVRHALWT